MGIICLRCGKETEGNGVAFCPYCGAKLPAQPENPQNSKADAEAEKWIRKALSFKSYPDRKKILLEAQTACPDSREIEWELLFIGEEEPKKNRWALGFSIIKCWILEMYRLPANFSQEQRNRYRSQLFDDPKLIRCLNRFEDPEQKQWEYLLRLSREYLEIFLEGNSQVMGTIFGFQLDRNKEKKMAAPVAGMIHQIMKDEKLLPQQREQLRQALYQAYSERANGKTEYLDERLKE